MFTGALEHCQLCDSAERLGAARLIDAKVTAIDWRGTRYQLPDELQYPRGHSRVSDPALLAIKAWLRDLLAASPLKAIPALCVPRPPQATFDAASSPSNGALLAAYNLAQLHLGGHAGQPNGCPTAVALLKRVAEKGFPAQQVGVAGCKGGVLGSLLGAGLQNAAGCLMACEDMGCVSCRLLPRWHLRVVFIGALRVPVDIPSRR